MKYLFQSLYYWLAAGSGNEAISNVVTCSTSTVTLSDSSSPLQVGQIFVHVADNQRLCRDKCGVLFREIVGSHGAGIYTTKPATFAQVFPAETYEEEYANTAIESVLPTCDDFAMEEAVAAAMSRRRGLLGAAPEVDARNLQTDEVARKKEDDHYYDDKYYYDDRYDDKYVHDDKYVDDEYHSPDPAKKGFRAFLDATKKFIFDMYCIIRGLDCTPYHPGTETDDYHDDKYASPSKDGYKDYEALDETQEQLPSTRRRTRGVKGGSVAKARPSGVRSLQDLEAVQELPTPAGEAEAETEEEDPPSPAPTPEEDVPAPAPVKVDGDMPAPSSTVKDEDDMPAPTPVEDKGDMPSPAPVEEDEEDSETPGEAIEEKKNNDDHYEDDHYEDDHYEDDHYNKPTDDYHHPTDDYHHPTDDYHHPVDDYYDDDDHDDSGNNFWKILDAVFGYFERIWCIFHKCTPDYPTDDAYTHDDKYYHDDKYPSKDKDNDKYDKPKRALSALEPESWSSFWSSSWWSTILGEPIKPSEDLFQHVPTSMEEWLLLDDEGNCPFTGCHDVDTPNQCFEGQHVVGKTCRDTLNHWFSLPSPGEDNVMSWELDMACYGQDYCYASNIFEQTLCDQQFYKSLMQACPSSFGGNGQSMTLSRDAPLATIDLYEQCSLVSILLYSKLQQQGRDAYELTQEHQSLFESNDCRRR